MLISEVLMKIDDLKKLAKCVVIIDHYAKQLPVHLYLSLYDELSEVLREH